MELWRKGRLFPWVFSSKIGVAGSGAFIHVVEDVGLRTLGKTPGKNRKPIAHG